MTRSTTRRRTVSQTRLLCATVFTGAFVTGLATAFAVGLWSREAALEQAPPPPVETAAVVPDLALAGLPDTTPPPAADVQLARLETVVPGPELPPVGERDRVYTSGVIARGESLAYSLGQQGIPRLTVHQITSELAKHFDFRRAQPGHAYRITQDAEGRVIEFRYSTSPMEGFTLALEGDRYVVRRDELQLEPREARIAGVVTTSLHDAVKALGESPQLASDFADIFAWDIDFTRSVRPGDEFRILYERLYFIDQNGKQSYLRPGRILAAQYSGAAGEHVGGLLRDPAGAGRLLPRRRQLGAAAVPAGAAALRADQLALQPGAPASHPSDHASAPGDRLRGAGRHADLGGGRRPGDLPRLRRRLRQPGQDPPLAAATSRYYGHLSRFAPGSRSASTCARSR